VARSDTQALETRVAKVREILAREPEDATLWFTLGRTLQELGRPDHASPAFRRAIEIDARYSAAYRDLGRVLMEAGELEEALRTLEAGMGPAEEAGDLQTLREIESFLRRCQRALGREPGKAKDQRAAKTPRLAHAGESSEATAEARRIYRQGFDHFANDRFESAVEFFQRALDVDPELAIAWNGLSLARRQQGDLEAAVEAGKRLIEIEPEDPLSHTNLSILYQRMGMIPEAEEERALAMQMLMRSTGGSDA